ncbi:Acidic repeat-containing protein [Trichinella zimbabwensis]|uniref:Acidic repeat-containing protein n=1 Tax=Trichinella zimbabwensis TaxID=268475 RepID=A0A0V1I7C7_9BILA|nr:Acidic repeat-containing protein [Trichinella zimbabwensis]
MVMNVIRDLYPELSSEELSKISLHFKRININEKNDFEVDTKENGILHVKNVASVNNERIRDTLLHEMCHAAVWIIDQKIEKHGPFWKRWCAIAESVLPNMPVVKTCHEYVITTKYVYRCPSCLREVRRQTKSLNIARKVCKFCRKHFICFKLNSKTGKYVPCNGGIDILGYLEVGDGHEQ